MNWISRRLARAVFGVLVCGLSLMSANTGGWDHPLAILAQTPDAWGEESLSDRPALEVADVSTSKRPALPPPPPPPPGGGCTGAVDYQDPTYGAQVRRLRKDDGNEHGLYYHRNPWNADSTLMLAAWEDLVPGNWDLVLLDRDGCYVETLFPVNHLDWRLVWDRKDPKTFYTWHAKTLYRFNVTTGVATPVKTFSAPLMAAGPSINQDNTKLLVLTGETIPVLRVLRMSDWTELASFTITKDGSNFKGTTDCSTAWQDVRLIGYRDYIYAACGGPTTRRVRIFKGDGTLHHEFSGWKYVGGHTDFSPDGRWAYSEFSNGLRIHVVDIDGTDDTVVFSAPKADVQWVRNLHISWPDRVPDYFFVSLFPSADNPAPPDAPLSDELMIVHTSGTAVSLARTYGSSKPFWSQGLASSNADGTLVSFSSNRCPVAGDPCASTIDLHIVTVPTWAIDP